MKFKLIAASSESKAALGNTICEFDSIPQMVTEILGAAGLLDEPGSTGIKQRSPKILRRAFAAVPLVQQGRPTQWTIAYGENLNVNADTALHGIERVGVAERSQEVRERLHRRAADELRQRAGAPA